MGPPGLFSLDYSFIDNDSSDLKEGVPEVKITIVKVVDIIEVEELIKEEYNLTWVYVLAGLLTPSIGAVVFLIVHKCKKHIRLYDTVMEERASPVKSDSFFVKRVPEGSGRNDGKGAFDSAEHLDIDTVGGRGLRVEEGPNRRSKLELVVENQEEETSEDYEKVDYYTHA